MTRPTDRCFICSARIWDATDRSLAFPSGRRRRFGFACGSCGVLADDPAAGAQSRLHLRAQLAGEACEPDETAPYGMDAYTLRTAASAYGCMVKPEGAEQWNTLRYPHGENAARARLRPLASGADPCVSLGILCRPDDVDGVLAGLSAQVRWTDDIVVMVDAESAPVPVHGGIRIVARPMSGDFGEQRNALQALGRKPWMLQLDADEALAPDVAHLLPALARMAERDGAVSIGLPRRNLVDGVLSEVFPDVQYRLNRSAVRFTGRVHERPDRPWQTSFIALAGAIDHHLRRDHVLSRSRRYEAMEPGRGRMEETEALLTPYRD